MRSHVCRLALPLALLAACAFPMPAAATDFTDIWYVADEPGWGVNIVQSDAFLFATFFIYGADEKPTWYTAQLTWDGTRYAGNLYATQGSPWSAPWNPSDHPPAQQVGVASFQPDAQTAYRGTLAYAVNGTGAVTRTITRQSLTQIGVAGSYLGAQAGAYAGCAAGAGDGPYTDRYALTVTQSAANAAILRFTYDSGATCTLAGTLQQYGQLYEMIGASYQCTGNLTFATTATLYELKATAQGLEGRLSANLPSGCQENANFSGVLL